MKKDHIVLSVCPKCKSELTKRDNEYFCKSCQLGYPVLEKVPCMLSDVNEKLKALQKRHYEKDVLKVDSIRRAIDREGFKYNLTLKASKISKVISSIGLFQGAGVLDIGCRDGRLLNKIGAQFKTNNYGIDISLNQMQENVKSGLFNNDYFVADAEFLPFAENSFDFIFCFDVLEHLPDYQKCIKETAFVLKEGATALFYAISKKQKYTWGWFLKKATLGLLGKGMGEVHQREYFLSSEEAVNWCKKSGLEVEKVIYFHCFFVWAFDSLFLSVKDILGPILNRRKKTVKQESTLAGNAEAKKSKGLIFIRVWSVFINSLLPVLEFLDIMWKKKGYSSGFFLQAKKKKRL
ncbi:MAG: methyltransferase domain-containing protein [bacterium]